MSPINSSAEAHNESTPIGELLDKTNYWHGTGRYQYDEAGKVIDVFAGILENGGFIPRQDDWDLSRSMTSTSFARERNYALLYADMHSTDPDSLERATPHSELARRYTKGIAAQALKSYFKENGLRETVKKARSAHKTLVKQGRWPRKVNSSQPPIKKIFSQGSDIDDNYPILFGLKELRHTERIAPYLDQHEARTSEPVLLEDCSYIEVPRSKVEEIKALLSEHSVTIAVVATEDVEKYEAEI